MDLNCAGDRSRPMESRSSTALLPKRPELLLLLLALELPL
jgi:hypothetical protein